MFFFLLQTVSIHSETDNLGSIRHKFSKLRDVVDTEGLERGSALFFREIVMGTYNIAADQSAVLTHTFPSLTDMQAQQLVENALKHASIQQRVPNVGSSSAAFSGPGTSSSSCSGGTNSATPSVSPAERDAQMFSKNIAAVLELRKQRKLDEGNQQAANMANLAAEAAAAAYQQRVNAAADQQEREEEEAAQRLLQQQEQVQQQLDIEAKLSKDREEQQQPQAQFFLRQQQPEGALKNLASGLGSDGTGTASVGDVAPAGEMGAHGMSVILIPHLCLTKTTNVCDVDSEHPAFIFKISCSTYLGPI